MFFHSPVKIGLTKSDQLPYILQATSEQAPEERRTSIFTRKAPFHYGWDWGPRLLTSGIWQEVYIEAWDNINIENTYFKPISISSEKASYNLEIETETQTGLKGELRIRIGKETEIFSDIHFASGNNITEIPITITSPQLWTIAQFG